LRKLRREIPSLSLSAAMVSLRSNDHYSFMIHTLQEAVKVLYILVFSHYN
jgi:hypothetical protein